MGVYWNEFHVTVSTVGAARVYAENSTPEEILAKGTPIWPDTVTREIAIRRSAPIMAGTDAGPVREFDLVKPKKLDCIVRCCV